MVISTVARISYNDSIYVGLTTYKSNKTPFSSFEQMKFRANFSDCPDVKHIRRGAGTRGGKGGSCPPALLTRGARGAVLLLAFHWDSNEVKRLLCIAKVSHISSFSFASIFCSYSSFSGTRFQFLRTVNVYLGQLGLASFFGDLDFEL